MEVQLALTPSEPTEPRAERWRLEVAGTVQAVGFRPFVCRLAAELGLGGLVRNTAHGVTVEIEGTPRTLEHFGARLVAEAPAAARVERVDRAAIAPRGDRGFNVVESQAGRAATMIPPDLAVCADCAREIFDPGGRRYRYPFTNCTHCGPRLTVVERLPYDRPSTTLADFPLCAECAHEYGDPSNRRFRAEPAACRACGPRAWLEEGGKPAKPGGDAIARAAELLRSGGLVAIQGVGGVHLACDATNEDAVLRLRAVKRRARKPLALMVESLAAAELLASPSAPERALLSSPEAPIVLVRRRAGAPLAASIAPANDHVGIMLAYSPLHLLLLADAGRPLVMTSANLPGEPLARCAEEARLLFGESADALLLHDRPIHQRCDDGVWTVGARGPQPIRLGRGGVPEPLKLPVAAPLPLVAIGGDIKNAFCLLEGDRAFMSQHVGNLSHAPTRAHFHDSLEKWACLTGTRPLAAAHDLHPETAGRALAAALELDAVEVQHHHAHIASCLAENGRRGPVIGVALDGTGYGSDGAIWGGDFLVADLNAFARAGHLEYLPLAGGDAAVRHPARTAAAYLLATLGDVSLPELREELGADCLRVLARMIERGTGTVATSSCGRLFDAVAAMLGIVLRSTFEGEAPITLETLAREHADEAACYPFSIDPLGVVALSPLLGAVLDDVGRCVSRAAVARRFHNTVIEIVRQQASRIAAASGLSTVALSGGCFQNRLLLDGCIAGLERDGFEVLVHHRVPANDGGLALGQAAVAAARLSEGRTVEE